MTIILMGGAAARRGPPTEENAGSGVNTNLEELDLSVLGKKRSRSYVVCACFGTSLTTALGLLRAASLCSSLTSTAARGLLRTASTSMA